MRQLVFLAAWLLAVAWTCAAQSTIAGIDFFGYEGIDVEAVRAALPLKPGDTLPENRQSLLRQAVEETIGAAPTNVIFVCCEPDGKSWVYIGLPGGSMRPVPVAEAPGGAIRAPAELMALKQAIDKALQAAVQRGGESTYEDRELGYALSRDPDSRAGQLSLREYALAHGETIFAVLAESSDARHRAAAAWAAGYVEHSAEQIRALTAAAGDSDGEVCNDAIRALGVLATAQTRLVEPIPVKPFIDLLYSGLWTDRNKAVFVLFALTRSGPPETLTAIREQALTPLREMALWGSHHEQARWILGRIAGLDEATIIERFATASFVQEALERLRQ